MTHVQRSRWSVWILIVSMTVLPDAGLADAPSLADRVIEHKLSNGMIVLLVERHQTPVVSINLTFGVGGINEQVGQTGFAHLYEHMAFKGTRTVGTKDYEKEKACSRNCTKSEQTWSGGSGRPR